MTTLTTWEQHEFTRPNCYLHRKPAARLPVACTVVEDYHRGHDLTARWYGRATPTAGDLEAARLALQGHCTHLPYFRFFGSRRDLQIWIHLGYVHPTDDIWYWTRGPWTAVGVPEQPTAPVPTLPSPNLGRGAGGEGRPRTAHWPLTTARYPLTTAHWPLTTDHCRLPTDNWPLPFRHYPR